MTKNKVKKKFLITGIIVFFFLFLFLLATKNNNYSKIEKITHELGSYFERIFIINNSISNNITNGINRELENEINELKRMLELEVTEYKFIHANVIKRDIDWYQEITIDKGEKDGIKLDMAVVSNNGLIGRIIKTTNSSSIVKLLSSGSNNMKISVTIRTKNNEIHGIIDEYLENDQLVQVNNVLKTENIEVGDKVYTSGLGGIYPSGIYIGKVIEISEDNLGLNKILKIKTDTSYDNLRFVSVVDRSQK